jgi:hypothetical protein
MYGIAIAPLPIALYLGAPNQYGILAGHLKDLMSGPMEQTEEQQSDVESISDETGQFDPRFVLWRKFCADEGVAIDTLPSDLCGEAKEHWEKIKQGQLARRIK